MDHVSEKQKPESGAVLGARQTSSHGYRAGEHDEAMAAFESLDEKIELDEATNRRLLRKIDLALMPVSVS